MILSYAHILVMKRVVSALLLWGAVNLIQPLYADVVYHLSVLIDPNLNDSIALINLFPGNSSISVTNPDSEQSEVFIVQQRTTIGRKVALSPSAANRLGLGAKSIAQVRIVSLALDGEKTDVNPATEYQDIIAGPTETENTKESQSFYNPPIAISQDSSAEKEAETSNQPSIIPPKSLSDSIPSQKTLLTEQPSLTGLPPIIKTPPPSTPLVPSPITSPPGSPEDESLIIQTKEGRLHIPLSPDNKVSSSPSDTGEATKPLAPNPQPRSGLIEQPPPKKIIKEKPVPLKVQLPPGDTLPPRNKINIEDSDTKPQLSNPTLPPKQEIPLEKNDPPRIQTISPKANEPTSSPPTIPPKEEELVSAVSPMGDAQPIDRHINKPESKISSPQSIIPENLKGNFRESPFLTNIPKGGEIYFPTIGDMNPPPESGQPAEPTPSIIIAQPSSQPETPLSTDEVPIAPSINTPKPSKKISIPPPIQLPKIIGNLNRIDLPEGYYIQLASFQDIRKTKQVYEQFFHEYKVNIIPAEVKGKRYYRCLIGGLEESQVAEILRRIRTAGYKDAFVYKNS